MEGRTDLAVAKKLFGENFIGIDELTKIASQLGVLLPESAPVIPYTKSELEEHAADCILILGVDKMEDSKPLTLTSLRERFGLDPAIYEPCFYNQDWYIKESFMQTRLENKWYLIKKNVFEESRAVTPTLLINKYNFPPAVLCAFTFFTYWFHSHKVLWKYDFIWCSDIDHNEDRIYVGKYVDIDGINKNGFSIHRHLALSSTYSAISIF